MQQPDCSRRGAGDVGARMTGSARPSSLLHAGLFTAMSVTCTPSLLAAQAARNDSAAAVSPRTTMRIGISRSVAGFRSEVVFAGGGGPVREYRVRPAAAIGVSAAVLRRGAFGLDVEADVLAPVRLSEVQGNRTVNGSSVAALAALSASYAPRALCERRCLRFAVGPGVGFYRLAEHFEAGGGVIFASSGRAESALADAADPAVTPRATALADVVSPLGKSQIAFALRAGIEYRLPGRMRSMVLGLSDYMAKLAPAGYGGAGISPVHQVVLSLRVAP